MAFDFSTFREILGFSVGILYLWWEYHADAKVWLASVVMPAISMWIYYSKGLYADFAINIYYLVIAVYGFITWTRGGTKGEKKDEIPITHVPGSMMLLLLLIGGVVWLAIWWLLTKTDSTVPVADAFTTAFSIIGLWMLAKKYAEQWIVWLVVDVVCSALYFYKGLPFYCVLYAIYSVIAILGYRKWLRLMKEEVI